MKRPEGEKETLGLGQIPFKHGLQGSHQKKPVFWLQFFCSTNIFLVWTNNKLIERKKNARTSPAENKFETRCCDLFSLRVNFNWINNGSSSNSNNNSNNQTAKKITVRQKKICSFWFQFDVTGNQIDSACFVGHWRFK